MDVLHFGLLRICFWLSLLSRSTEARKGQSKQRTDAKEEVESPKNTKVRPHPFVRIVESELVQHIISTADGIGLVIVCIEAATVE
jgi:hypothetical protein